MENQKSFLDKIIEEIRFSGNVSSDNVIIEKDNKIKEDKKENYISENIYILSPN
jgi:hypothetical protein